MKTTIDISDVMFQQAKQLSAERKITLRSLFEEGLQRILQERQNTPLPKFTLTDASVGQKKGKGALQPAHTWRDLANETP